MDDQDEKEVSVTSDFADPLVGRDFAGKYRIRNKLGEGGFGTVYRAIQLTVGREVAVKVLRPDRAQDDRLRETLVKRFQREAVAMSKLGHPNTVQLIDFGTTEDGILFLVLELLSGYELSQVVATQAPLLPSRVAHICRQICLSLSEAHASGIIHRDLKPGNVFLCHVEGDDDYVKVMDFGIARVVTAEEEQGNLTKTGMTQGTPAYMSPEQAMALKTTPASDLYSLGCMMFEMLTGKMPFTGDSSTAISLSHVNDVPPTLIIPGGSTRLSSAWNELFQALAKKKKKQRPQSTQEVIDRLLELAALPDPGLEDPLEELQAEETVLAQVALTDPDADSDAKTELVMPGLGASALPDGGVEASEGSPPSSLARFLAFGILFALAIVGLVALVGGGDTNEPNKRSPERPVAQGPAGSAAPPAAPERGPDSSATQAPAGSAPAPIVPVVAGPQLAHLVLASEPSGALVYRAYGESEVLLCSTPCDVKVPAGDGIETLTLRADQHLDKELKVDLSADAQVVLALNLERTSRRRASRRGAGSPKRKRRNTAPANLPALRTTP